MRAALSIGSTARIELNEKSFSKTLGRRYPVDRLEPRGLYPNTPRADIWIHSPTGQRLSGKSIDKSRVTDGYCGRFRFYRVRSSRSLFDEVHFYLICWARIAKLTRFIARCTRFRRTGLVLRRYHAELAERVNGRDHLEHFEERLPGEPKRHALAIPGNLLNMAGHFLTYGGRRIDVGPASAILLRAIVTEFRTALLFDSVEALAAADPNQALILLRRAGSRVHLARVAKEFERLFGSSTRGGAKRPAERRVSPDAEEPRR